MSSFHAPQQTTPNRTTGILRGGPLAAGIEVGVVVTEEHNMSARPSETALESGAIVSEHIIIDPASVNITFEVPNSGDGPTIAKDVFEALKTALEGRNPVELLTEHFIYENMALTRLTPVHQAPFRGRLQCTASLRQIKFNKIAIVGKAPAKLSGKTKKTASAQENAGVQAPRPVNKSLLEKIRDGVARRAP